jgi:hypothetical protein
MPSAEHRTEILTARTRAFRFRKGQSGNPDGQSRFYLDARKLARHAASEVMEKLIAHALDAEDERVRSVCAVAVPGRAGVRSIDFDQRREKWSGGSSIHVTTHPSS